MSRRPIAVLVLLALLFVNLPFSISAQDATPAATGDRVDLAAMTLDSDDVPEGYVLGFEGYSSAEEFANSFGDPRLAGQLLNAGLISVYVSTYDSTGGEGSIRSYIEKFDSDEGARAGFELLEDESRFITGTDESSDEPLQGVGEEPGEITTYSSEASADSPAVHGVDVTFRIGNHLAGVTVERTGGAAPATSDAVTLARRLEERINLVIAGEPIPGIDPSLPGRMLTFEESFPALLEGYQTAVDGFGPAATDAAFAEYESGYTRTTALGQGDAPLPLLTNSISTFSSEDGPLAIISGGDKFQPPFDRMERVEIDPIEGATAASAFHFVSPLGEGSEINSYRILSVVGSFLVTIDVQAAANEEVAQRLALELTEQQLGCIDEGNCARIEQLDTGS